MTLNKSLDSTAGGNYAHLNGQDYCVFVLVVAVNAPITRCWGKERPPSVGLDLQVVDCLLPGQVRRLGQSRYITARRPIMTTAADCRIRGGEYTEFDRADYRTALNVWMPTAEAGDPEAQTNVGEIFERVSVRNQTTNRSDLVSESSRPGFCQAQFNWALCERGLGVEADKLTALNWYRKAWECPSSVVYQRPQGCSGRTQKV